ncbi:MAG: FtsX-like permease family protein [Deltaproteobacteria bacterium]|nr:FtsX-like permease family protein [Deltaproteobacteria bacterium]
MKWLGLALRNLKRHRGRVIGTVVGVAVSLMAFMILRTVIFAWTVAAEDAAQDRIATRHKVTFIMPLPKRYIDKIRATNGVSAATWANWFGGKHPKREQEFFATLAVDTDSFFDVYNDMVVPAEQLADWKQDRRGAIIGTSLAKKFGWKVGDKINLRGTIFPGTWSFNVRGVYTAVRRGIDPAQLIFHWQYLNESKVLPGDAKDLIGWVIARISDPKRSAAISKSIDDQFDGESDQTATMSERDLYVSFMGMFSAVLGAIDVISLVIIAIMGLILGNTIAMGVRERTNEYGVLRAIGFENRHLAGMILTEGLLIGVLGAVVGLALAYPLVNHGMGLWIEENMGSMFPYFRIPGTTMGLCLLIGLVLGTLAAAIPAYRTSKLSVVDALRRI